MSPDLRRVDSAQRGQVAILETGQHPKLPSPRAPWDRAQARLQARLRPAHWTVLVEDLAAAAAAARRA